MAEMEVSHSPGRVGISSDIRHPGLRPRTAHGHLHCDDCPGKPERIPPCFPSPSWDQPGQLHWNLPLRWRLGLPPDFGDPVINFRHIGARVQI